MESKLQKKIIHDLRLKGWYVVKIVMSNTNGIPDVWAGRAGMTIWMEIKDGSKKKPKPLQELRHSELRTKGFTVLVIDSWDCYLRHKDSVFM